MAEIAVFPLARRRGLVRSQAACFLSCSRGGAERNLQRILRQQAAALARKGLGSAEVEAQVNALEMAVRCEIARCNSRELGA